MKMTCAQSALTTQCLSCHGRNLDGGCYRRPSSAREDTNILFLFPKEFFQQLNRQEIKLIQMTRVCWHVHGHLILSEKTELAYGGDVPTRPSKRAPKHVVAAKQQKY